MTYRTILGLLALLMADLLAAETAHLRVSLPESREAPMLLVVAIDDAYFASRAAKPGSEISLKIPREGYYMLETRYPSGHQHSRTILIPAGTSRSKPFEVHLSEDETLFAQDLAAGRNLVSLGTLEAEDTIRKALRVFEHAMEVGDTERAEEVMSGLLQDAPRAAIAWNNLGAIRLQQKRLDEAIELLRRAHQLDDSLFEANLNYGRALFVKGQYEAAYRSAVRALEIRRQHPNANALAAQSLFLLERQEEAVPYIRGVLELDPFHVSFPDLLLAAIHQNRGEMQAAAEHVIAWAKKHPGHPDVPSLRAKALSYFKVPATSEIASSNPANPTR